MPATSVARGRLVVFGALIAVLVLLCTGQAAGAAENQPGHSSVSQHSSAASRAAAARAAQAAEHKAALRKAALRKAAEHKAAEHRSVLRKAAERKAAGRKAAEHRAALRQAAERHAVEADSVNPASDAARPAAASRAASQDAAKRHVAQQARHATHHRSRAAKKDDEESLADRKQAAADAQQNRRLDEDGIGSPDRAAALPARSQRAAKAAAEAAAKVAAEAAARLAAAEKAAEQLVGQQAGQPSKQEQPVREVGIRSPGTAGSTSDQQPAVGLSPSAASQASPPARRASHPSGARSLPHRIISEPAEPIVALATAGLSVGSAPALLVLAVIAIVGLLLVAAGTRRTWLRG